MFYMAPSSAGPPVSTTRARVKAVSLPPVSITGARVKALSLALDASILRRLNPRLASYLAFVSPFTLFYFTTAALGAVNLMMDCSLSDSTPPNTLLSIAPEIRLCIYREPFRPLTVTFSVSRVCYEYCVSVSDNNSEDGNLLSILLASKKMYHEGRSAFLSNALFDLTTSEAVHEVLPPESAQVTRIIISYAAATIYAKVRHIDFLNDMTNLFVGKEEIQIEMPIPTLFEVTLSAGYIQRKLNNHMTPGRSFKKKVYQDGGFFDDCVSAMYSGSSSAPTCAGIFILIRPTRNRRLTRYGMTGGIMTAFTKPTPEDTTYLVRKFRYNKDKDTLDLLESPGEEVSVPVPRVNQTIKK